MVGRRGEKRQVAPWVVFFLGVLIFILMLSVDFTNRKLAWFVDYGAYSSRVPRFSRFLRVSDIVVVVPIGKAKRDSNFNIMIPAVEINKLKAFEDGLGREDIEWNYP